MSSLFSKIMPGYKLRNNEYTFLCLDDKFAENIQSPWRKRKNMKKILVFHPIIAPYRIDFFNALSEHFDTEVCLFWRNLKDQTFDYDKIESQFKFKPKYIVKEELGTLAWLMALWQEISICKPEIVYVGEYGLTTILTILYRIVTRAKYKIVAIVDDSYNMLADDNHFTKKHKYALNLLAPLLDEIQNVEPRVVEWYQKKFCKGMYFPIVCEDDMAIERQKVALPISERYIKNFKLEGKKILLFVGRLVELKNIDFAIKAFVKSEIPDSFFIIVGSGNQETYLKVLAQPYDNVILVGRYEGVELYAWYNVANVFTLQSIQEAFGAVTNEALVAGCKCLISKDAGSNCLIKDGVNGFVINPYNEDDYINKLKSLMDEAEPISLPLNIRKNQMQESFNDCMNRLIKRLDTL